MQRLVAVALVLLSAQAFAATATWTGRSHFGQSVTGRPVMNCEYQFAGRTFWRAFENSCAATVEVV